MSRTTDIASVLAAALVAAILVAALTPVCAMAECDQSSVGPCSDFRPACDACPDAVVMKHSHDDATGTAVPQADPPVAVATLPLEARPVLLQAVLREPDVTASPPPPDPLGVRLTI